MYKTRFALALLASVVMSGAAQAALINNGGGLIYDSTLNVTWLQDANYANTSGYSSGGRMTWNTANTWASTLNYHGITGWRLPTVSPVNGSSFNYSESYNGTTDVGYNIISPASELSHLFYVDLGNKGFQDTSGSYQAGYGLTHTGPFINLQYDPNFQMHTYWSGTQYAPNTNYYAWLFSMGFGNQYVFNKYLAIYAMAVHPGDVSLVPEPGEWAMMLGGLGLMSFIAMRRAKTA